MENQVTFKLKNMNYAPWGIFLDDPTLERPIPVVWLTSVTPTGSCDKDLLSEEDIKRISASIRAGIVEVEGIEALDDVKPMVLNGALIGRHSMQNQLNSGMNQDQKVTALLEKEENDVIQELTHFATSGTNLAFFTKCRKAELAGEQRYKILKFLNTVIEDLMDAIEKAGNRVDQFTGKSKLSDAFFEMVEELTDGEEEIPKEEVLESLTKEEEKSSE
jgi:hypothetical protein